MGEEARAQYSNLRDRVKRGLEQAERKQYSQDQYRIKRSKDKDQTP